MAKRKGGKMRKDGVKAKKKLLQKTGAAARQAAACKAILREQNHRVTIIGKLKKSFNEEDKTEPFDDREYVDESNRLFDLLMEEYPIDPQDSRDRAIVDIVIDIFRVCGKEPY